MTLNFKFLSKTTASMNIAKNTVGFLINLKYIIMLVEALQRDSRRFASDKFEGRGDGRDRDRHGLIDLSIDADPGL